METQDEVIQRARELFPILDICQDRSFDGLILYEGLDSALIGIGFRDGHEMVAVYSYEKIIEHFQASGMTRGEAQEYYEFNVEGLVLGPQTPIVLLAER